MKCKDIQRKLSAYMDGELSESERKQMSSHLEDCPDCVLALERLTKTWEILDLLAGAEPDPYFYTRLKARRASDKRERRESLIGHVLVPVCSVIVVMLGITMGSLAAKNGDAIAVESSVEEEMVNTLHLDSFNDLPTTSVGEAYYNLTYAE